MKTPLSRSLFTAITVLALFSAAAAPAQTIVQFNEETPAMRDARMAWWREARFGMFIHWGV